MKPKIYFSIHAYRQMKYYVDKVDSEISGMGVTEIINGKDILVKRLYLLEQESGAATTEFDNSHVSKLIRDLIKKGIDHNTLNLWWHSHANFNVFWSLEDVNTMNNFKTSDYMVSTVFNKDMEVKGRIDLFKPFRAVFDCDVELYLENNYIEKQVMNEIEKKVNTPEKVITGYNNDDLNNVKYIGSEEGLIEDDDEADRDERLSAERDAQEEFDFREKRVSIDENGFFKFLGKRRKI